MSTDYAALFWSKVEKGPSCWLWTASTMGAGYGQCTTGHRRQGYAHRFSYELAHGPIPDGNEIDHVCMNRLCVRPDHLRLASRKQNCEHHVGAYSNSKSGVRGVSWHKQRRKWVAQVVHNQRTIYLGLYADINEASQAAKSARIALFTHNDIDRESA